MGDFPEELRRTFEADQRRLEVDGVLTGRLLARGLAHGGRAVGIRQVAGALAVLAAVLAVVGLFTAIRVTTGPSTAKPEPKTTSGPTVAPTARTSPTPVAAVFELPDSVPAIVFHDPVERTQLDAVGWSGDGLGRLPLPPGGGYLPNSDGTRFIGPSGTLDRRGHGVGDLAVAGKVMLPAWSDDGKTLCRTTQAGPGAATRPSVLEVSAGNGWRTVGHYGTASENGGVGIVACSTLGDRAVLVQHTFQGASQELWVVQLSSGRVVWGQTFAQDSAVVSLVASRDGSRVAVGRALCCPIHGYATTVYGGAGETLTSFGGHVGGWVGLGFSWDGSLVVVADGNDESDVSVIDLASGKAIWRAQPGLKVAQIWVEPGGQGRVALLLNTHGAFAGSDGYPPAGEVVTVGRQGAKDLGLSGRP